MSNMMGGEKGQGGGRFDRDQIANMMGSASALTLEEHLTYASAESVQDFYYTLTASFNGSDTLLPVTDETEEAETDSNFGSMSGSQGKGNGSFGRRGTSSSADFSVIGYSSDNAMSAFIDGTASILEGGTMFEEGSSEQVCVISEELAIFNDLSVGDTIILTNPSLEAETYEVEIVGLYASTANNDFSMSMFGKSQEQRAQLFERFYRLDSARNGEDKHYGLAIAKSIVEAHKGKIDVHCFNEFVEFRVLLPLA